MIDDIGNLVATGFTAGIVTGLITFIINWILSSAMNILKFPKEGD